MQAACGGCQVRDHELICREHGSTKSDRCSCDERLTCKAGVCKHNRPAYYPRNEGMPRRRTFHCFGVSRLWSQTHAQLAQTNCSMQRRPCRTTAAPPRRWAKMCCSTWRYGGWDVPKRHSASFCPSEWRRKVKSHIEFNDESQSIWLDLVIVTQPGEDNRAESKATLA